MDKTPDHTVFCKVRQKIGAEKVADIFNIFKGQPRAQGYMGEVFVDAKANLWEERDEVRKKKYDKLSHDCEALIGCKRGSKFWYGYKKHGLSWIMQSGMINKVAVTPANVTDAQGFDQVAPEPRGLSHADKGYCTNPRSNDGSG